MNNKSVRKLVLTGSCKTLARNEFETTFAVSHDLKSGYSNSEEFYASSALVFKTASRKLLRCYLEEVNFEWNHYSTFSL